MSGFTWAKPLREDERRWRPASGHPRGWRVVRNGWTDMHGRHLEQAEDSAGRLRIFKTSAAARRVADTLNAVPRIENPRITTETRGNA